MCCLNEPWIDNKKEHEHQLSSVLWQFISLYFLVDLHANIQVKIRTCFPALLYISRARTASCLGMSKNCKNRKRNLAHHKYVFKEKYLTVENITYQIHKINDPIIDGTINSEALFQDLHHEKPHSFVLNMHEPYIGKVGTAFCIPGPKHTVRDSYDRLILQAAKYSRKSDILSNKNRTTSSYRTNNAG